ncbi:MAG: polyprenyl synthetase family protein [Saprospiraceae bacterium]|nr:polyprenyl synthetase family protein [Saprospiraceae bacterium]
MLSVEQLVTLFEHFRKANSFQGKVAELYQPASYLMDLGGKRLRPVFTLAAHQLFEDQIDSSLAGALAIEVFHNFSLMHDDIMDQSPLRRGQPTVHIRYDTNAAILSGDWMFVHTYELLSRYEPVLAYDLIQLMNQTAVQVCEGQQRDINFEKMDRVNEMDYLEMIRDKTAVLLGAAAQMGARIASATKDDQENLYTMGLHTGLAFQLIDDYLDVYGVQTGKKSGGDIRQNKKTILYIKTMERASEADREELLSLYQEDEPDKITRVVRLFDKYEAGDYLRQLTLEYSQQATAALNQVNVDPGRKINLISLLNELLNRNK